MIRTTLTAASFVLLGATAFAGEMVAPVVPAIVDPATKTSPDWSGGYVGLSYGYATGDIDFIPSPARSMDSGTAGAILGGYQAQHSSFVYGGEIAVNSLSGSAATGFPQAKITEMIDLKARAGYASGAFLFYGVLGYSSGTFESNPTKEWDIDGFNYGIGVDYALTNNWILGAEYLMRDLEGVNPTNSAQTTSIDYDTLSLRVSYKF
jgi:opacity protein-like surface antigen